MGIVKLGREATDEPASPTPSNYVMQAAEITNDRHLDTANSFTGLGMLTTFTINHVTINH